MEVTIGHEIRGTRSFLMKIANSANYDWFSDWIEFFYSHTSIRQVKLKCETELGIHKRLADNNRMRA